MWQNAENLIILKQMTENKNTLVSIVMPSHNCGAYIEASIRSVLAQTYTEWELIVIDDGSTDDSLQIVERLRQGDSRIRILQQNHVGAAHARNYALREARGRWIAFLDSDDQWLPEKLEHQLAFMVQHGYSFSYTNYEEMNAQLQPTGRLITGPKHISKMGMWLFCWPGCLTVMYDAQKVGLVQINPLRKNNDYALWLKIIREADCHLLDENLARYLRGRQGSISTHGVLKMVKWHYFLFRHAEQKSAPMSLLLTMGNLLFGALKKLLYVKNIEIKK